MSLGNFASFGRQGSSCGGVEWWYLPSDFSQLSLALEVLGVHGC